MNIKKLLKIMSAVVICIFVVFIGLIYWSERNYEQAHEKAQIASTIVLNLFERKLLGDEYLATETERALVQWEAQQQKLNDAITTHQEKFNNPIEKEYIESLKTGLAGSRDVLDETTELFNNQAIIKDSPEYLEQKARLAARLAVKAQETLSPAKTLANLNEEIEAQSLRQLVLFFSVIGIVFLLILIFCFVIIWNSADTLETSEERFRFVSKATSDAVYDWDIKTNGIYFGAGMYSLFGYGKDQVTESLEWWSSKLHPEDRDRTNQMLDEALKSDMDSFKLEYRFQKADGTYANVVDKAYLARDRMRKPIRYIGVMQDVTEGKNYEGELKMRTVEAERLNKIAVERELKMIELKKQLSKYE